MAKKTIKSSKNPIKASTTDRVIFEDEYFEFVKTGGIGINDTPWSGLEVKSKGLADKHVIVIELRSNNSPKFEGQPVHRTYKNAYVNQGMRSRINTLDETREVIKVLEDAVDFAERINEYLYKTNGGSTGDIESSTKIKGSYSADDEYEVIVNFAGYIGADETYNVIASDEDDALEQAIEEASLDLSVDEIEEIDEGEYEVHVGFCGFIGVEEVYTVFADSEEEAEEEALARAKDDLSAEFVDDEED